MKSELEKLSDNNLIALYNFATIAFNELDPQLKIKYYEYRFAPARSSLMYSIAKLKDLFNNTQEIALGPIDYDEYVNKKKAIACDIADDTLEAITREELIYLIDYQITSLLDFASLPMTASFDLYEAIKQINTIIDSKSLLNGVRFLA